MGWDRRHRRGDVLRHVSDRLDELHLQDTPAGAPGALEAALDCPGVPDTFADDVDLVAALLLRWHARLSAHLDAAVSSVQAGSSRDRPGAAAGAWARTATDLPGVRRLLDEQLDAPVSEPMRALVLRARGKERARLAWAAGTAAGETPVAVVAGGRVERAARERLARTAEVPTLEVAAPGRGRTVSGTSMAFVQRLRSLIPA